jgi:hypothetical protein
MADPGKLVHVISGSAGLQARTVSEPVETAQKTKGINVGPDLDSMCHVAGAHRPSQAAVFTPLTEAD